MWSVIESTTQTGGGRTSPTTSSLPPATSGIRSSLSAIASLSWFSLDLYLDYDPSRVANGEGAVAGEHASEGQSDRIQLIERGL
jgi:hypothetical protein